MNKVQEFTLPPLAERPLVTFALFAYNQEQYIREAVAGALAQTYTPLQIILSDDGSTDQTFAIMQEMVAAYAGPHEILLNRNETNMGIGGHFNYIMGLSKGTLIISAAGDDISISERTEVIYCAWVEAGQPNCSIYSMAIEIDDAGETLGLVGKAWNNSQPLTTLISKMMPGVMGATHAFHRGIYDMFGPMLPGSVYEDKILPFRAFMLGKIISVEAPLVKYRIHAGGISGEGTLLIRSYPSTSNLLKFFSQIFKLNLNVYDNYKKDLDVVLLTSNDSRKIPDYNLLKASVENLWSDAAIKNTLFNTRRFSIRLRYLIRVRLSQIRLESLWIYVSLAVSPIFFVRVWRFIHAGLYAKFIKKASALYIFIFRKNRK